MFQLNDNQLIRQKRDYNNKLELQDNRLQTEIDNQHDLEENKEDKLNIENKQNINTNLSKAQNSFEEKLRLIDNLDEDENSINSNSSHNINENKKFLNLKHLTAIIIIGTLNTHKCL